MDPINRAHEIRRELASHRLALAAAIAVGILCGLLVLLRPGLPPESRRYEVWLSQASLLVDTSDSQLVDTRALGFEALATRATLLGNLIATGPLKDRIAERAGVPADDLIVVPPATEISAGAPQASALEGIPDAEVTKLTATADPSVPILRIAAQAPDARTVEQLSRAAAEELSSYVGSVAATRDLPDTRKLVVSELASGAPVAAQRGPGPLLALGVTIVVAALGCAAIVFVSRLRARPVAAAELTVPNGRPDSRRARAAEADVVRYAAPHQPPAKAAAKGRASHGNGRSPQPPKTSRASPAAKGRNSQRKKSGGSPRAGRQRRRRKPEGSR